MEVQVVSGPHQLLQRLCCCFYVRICCILSEAEAQVKEIGCRETILSLPLALLQSSTGGLLCRWRDSYVLIDWTKSAVKDESFLVVAWEVFMGCERPHELTGGEPRLYR